jgi:WD40 repeat protein/serine/threonine protein kinase
MHMSADITLGYLTDLVSHAGHVPPADMLEAIRADQARRWRSGQPIRAEAYLDAFPKLPSADAFQVIWSEVLLRFEKGESPPAAEYQARFPGHAEALGLHFAQQVMQTADPDATLAPPHGGAGQVLPLTPGYEILGELGRGGMGVVYKARQTRLSRVVALKVILAGSHAGTDEMVRFRTEAQAVASLQHSNIVQIFEVGEQQGLPFFSLEYCSGGSLAARLDGTPLPAAQAAQLVETLARAIHAAHLKGIVHRDLKPANILFSAEGAPKITDFGLAKKLDDGAGPTASGAIMGTPSYMAPEQASGHSKQIGPAADVYALGAILYEVVTGRPPFRGATSLDTVMQVLNDEPVPPVRLQPKLPQDLDTICLKCLHKEPHKRYASAAALAEDLARFQADLPIQARPIGQVERFGRWCRRYPLVASLIAALAVFMMLTIVVLARSNLQIQQEQKQTREEQQKTEAALTREQQAREQEHQTTYFQRIALAEREVRDRNMIGAANLLEACPVGLRGWEWHYLMRRRYLEPRPLTGHDDGVLSVAFSPDGQRIASSSMRFMLGEIPLGEIKVWDARTGKNVLTLGGFWGHVGPISGVAFHPDGKRLASAGWDKGVKLWDLKTGQPLFPLAGHTEYVSCLTFSPDGKLLVTGSGDATLIVWDLATRKPLHTLRGHTGGIYGAAFHPDGRQLASASSDGTVKLWDITSGKAVQTLRGHSAAVLSVALSRDGARLAAGYIDGTIRIWETSTGEVVQVMRGPIAVVVSVAFSRDGRRLAAGSWEKTVKIWDVDSGQEVVSLAGHEDMVMSVAFSPDGNQLATGSLDQTIRIWDATPLTEESDPGTFILHGHTDLITCLAFSPDGSQLASTSFDETIILWDVAGRRQVQTLGDNQGPVYMAAFSRGGLGGVRLASASLSGTIKVREAATGKDLQTLHGFGGIAALSPDGQRVAAAYEGGLIRIWDVATGQEVKAIPQANLGGIMTVAFSPDGRYLASAGWDRIVKLWDTANWKPLRILAGPQGHTHVVHNVVFSNDGRHLASASWDRTAKVWDITTGKVVCTLSGHGDRVGIVTFSPRGDMLATAGADNSVKIWHTTSGKLLHSLGGHAGHGLGVAFSPDGNISPSAAASGARGRSDSGTWPG